VAVDGTARELIADCLDRIKAGDACAPMDLASAFMSHADAKDIGLYLAVVEALAVIAKKQGCANAEEFLQKQWPGMQEIFRKRWGRAGFM
jgi:hypothetical protein